MNRLLQLYHMVRHVRGRQLAARLRLMLRRKWRVRHAVRFRTRMASESLPELVLHEPLPLPVMPPRKEGVAIEGGVYTLTFLNESQRFTHPFKWHRAELEYGTRLWKLNLHYMEFLEGLDDRAFVRVVDDWIRHNPPYRPGYWLDDWNSYALSIRCVVWMQQYAVRHTSFTSDFKGRMLASLFCQIRFLSRNLELDIGGNHLIKNTKALLWAGRYFKGSEAEGWYKLGEELLTRALEEQVLEDGMHYERSPAYHGQVFVDLLESYTTMKDGAAREKLRVDLKAMAQVLADLTHPDGFPSQFNDGGLHMTYAPEASLAAWRRMTADDLNPRSVFYLPEAGYAGIRSQTTYVLCDCGKIAPDYLPAHGHGDIFSFEWSVAGKRLIIDAGVYEYNAGPRRAYSRSTRAHNTVTLNGADQCEFWGAFRVARRANVSEVHFEGTPNSFSLAASHDGYRRLPGKPIHTRIFDVKEDHLKIRDEIRGGAGQAVEAQLLLNPSCEAIISNGNVIITLEGIVVQVLTEGEVRLEKGYWYPDFGVEYSCPQLVIRYGTAPCTGMFELRRSV